jgi:hypothetical protein
MKASDMSHPCDGSSPFGAVIIVRRAEARKAAFIPIQGLRMKICYKLKSKLIIESRFEAFCLKATF